MTTLTFYAGVQPHFASHLAPIYHALPDDIRGPFHARSRAASRAMELGIEPVTRVPRRAEIVVVASYEDHRAVKPSPTVLLNHGVGQTYNGDANAIGYPSYSGGRDRERVVLYLCPSEHDAEVNRCAYPGAKAVAVGCPYLDSYHPPIPYSPGDYPLVAFSTHADVHVCPETRFAFPHFKQAITDIVKSERWHVAAHAHPRIYSYMLAYWNSVGVSMVDYDYILDNAAVYVCDNSSTLYEFASTGRPVITLSAPWYRRDVHHGLRFWDQIPGIHVDDPADLTQAIDLALLDPPEVAKRRAEVVSEVYVATDGHATQRAVTALMELIDA